MVGCCILRGAMRAAIQRQAKFLAMLLGLIVLAGCASAGSGGSGRAPAPTATLTANPSTITEQGFSTLSFSSTNADSGVIDNGVGQGLNGQRNVSPSVTTTYTFTVSGPGGSASAQATVTVTPPPPPPTITLTVTPAEIFPGQSITFTWQSTNATNVVIDNVVLLRPSAAAAKRRRRPSGRPRRQPTLPSPPEITNRPRRRPPLQSLQ